MSTDLIRMCEEQEERFQFSSFTQNDARKLGEVIWQVSQSFDKPAAIEIRLNGLTVYRFFPDGTNRNNEVWLRCKANSVDTLGISSYHLFAQLEESGETLAERRMDPDCYAACGGGFPLRVRGCAVSGTICVSGLPHEQDHQLIIDSLEKYFELYERT